MTDLNKEKLTEHQLKLKKLGLVFDDKEIEKIEKSKDICPALSMKDLKKQFASLSGNSQKNCGYMKVLNGGMNKDIKLTRKIKDTKTGKIEEKEVVEQSILVNYLGENHTLFLSSTSIKRSYAGMIINHVEDLPKEFWIKLSIRQYEDVTYGETNAYTITFVEDVKTIPDIFKSSYPINDFVSDKETETETETETL